MDPSTRLRMFSKSLAKIVAKEPQDLERLMSIFEGLAEERK
jgi:hypothetical protein